MIYEARGGRGRWKTKDIERGRRRRERKKTKIEGITKIFKRGRRQRSREIQRYPRDSLEEEEQKTKIQRTYERYQRIHQRRPEDQKTRFRDWDSKIQSKIYRKTISKDYTNIRHTHDRRILESQDVRKIFDSDTRTRDYQTKWSPIFIPTRY